MNPSLSQTRILERSSPLSTPQHSYSTASIVVAAEIQKKTTWVYKQPYSPVTSATEMLYKRTALAE